jgi:hypothetical protein
MDELTNRLYESLQEHCRFVTTPVAVKLAKEGDVTPQKARYPLAHVGNRLALCPGEIPSNCTHGRGGILKRLPDRCKLKRFYTLSGRTEDMLCN